MTRQVMIVFKIVSMFLLIGLLSCNEKAPSAPQSNVVKKKIVVPEAPSDPSGAVPVAAPTAQKKSVAQTGEGVTPSSEPLSKIPAVSQNAAAVTPDASPNQTAPPISVESAAESAKPATGSDLVSVSLQSTSTYDPRGRFDPFEPLFKEDSAANSAPTPKDKRQKRIPQTPLEKVALSQLKLSAIIWAASGNRALVEDGSGKGYVIETGTYIGLNSGKVIQIDKDRIVIEEEIEDLMGEVKIQNSELKLQKPAGEF